jgi:hypothetical protein
MSNKIDSGTPAYPTHGYQSGMTLRTAIAMDMAKGILAGRDTSVLSKNEIDEITENAVRMADKLIEQLNKI